MSPEQRETMEAEAQTLLESLPSAILQGRIHQGKETKDSEGNLILELQPTRRPLLVRIYSDERIPEPPQARRASIERFNALQGHLNGVIIVEIDTNLRLDILNATAEAKAANERAAREEKRARLNRESSECAEEMTKWMATATKEMTEPDISGEAQDGGETRTPKEKTP